LLFECPVCKQRHRVNDNYDNEDFICPNTGRNQKIFRRMVPDDLLSRNNLLNSRSTRINEARETTVLVEGRTSFRTTGEKLGTRQGYNY